MRAKAAVFTGVGKPLEMREFAVPPVEPGALLVRVSMCTVCGSDVHTWHGDRPGKPPMILGHEIMGTVAELGAGIETDHLGEPLRAGDRVTWAMYSSCGACYFCRVAGLPQKCARLQKYGHESCAVPPYVNGGFAEYVYLLPGTVVLRVPGELTDEEVTPVSCAMATIASGFDAVPVQPGDCVVVQGAGMLGLCAAAMAADRGAGCIVVIDVDAGRLAVAERFGATYCLDAGKLSAEGVAAAVRRRTGGRGADVVVEVTGNPAVFPLGVELLRIGGRYLLLGTVSPAAHAEIDLWAPVFKCLTIRGVHNYDARHLVQSLDFLRRVQKRFDFRALVTHRFPLEETETALRLALERVPIRAAVVPG